LRLAQAVICLKFLNEVTPDELKKRIPASELEMITSRSSGPGGQNVNKVNTKVEIRFNVKDSPFLSDAEKDLIFSRLKNRISASGIISVRSQSGRSQARNRELASERLFAILAESLSTEPERIPSRPTRSSVEKRLGEKRKRADLKKTRKTSRKVHDN